MTKDLRLRRSNRDGHGYGFWMDPEFGYTLNIRITFGRMVLLRILRVIDEFSRESLAIEVRRSFTPMDAIEVLSVLFITQR